MIYDMVFQFQQSFLGLLHIWTFAGSSSVSQFWPSTMLQDPAPSGSWPCHKQNGSWFFWKKSRKLYIKMKLLAFKLSSISPTSQRNFGMIRWALSPGVPSWGSLLGSHLWAEAHWPTPAGDRPHGPGQTGSPTNSHTIWQDMAYGSKEPELPFESQTKWIYLYFQIIFPNCYAGHLMLSVFASTLLVFVVSWALVHCNVTAFAIFDLPFFLFFVWELESRTSQEETFIGPTPQIA